MEMIQWKMQPQEEKELSLTEEIHSKTLQDTQQERDINANIQFCKCSNVFMCKKEIKTKNRAMYNNLIIHCKTHFQLLS